MNTLSPRDLVVLVQSTSFRLNDFRFRLELFNRSLAVIEHPHLGRMPEEEHQTYVDSLAYDVDYYRTVGPKLKAMIDTAKRVVVSCEGTELVYDGPLESGKLNTGDYTGMKNIGGQFPIGEVFTELVDLSQVNGQVKIYAFANRDFRVIVPEVPVLATIEKGIITKTENATPEFLSILEQIQTDELLTIRELGFGMNRAMTRTRLLADIGSYERMCGIHLSLGAKHTIYAKPGFSKRQSRYHVDVFVDVTTVTIDGVTVFKDGAYTV
jgi:leucyl aminopeptidase (aminopeptidase T)